MSDLRTPCFHSCFHSPFFSSLEIEDQMFLLFPLFPFSFSFLPLPTFSVVHPPLHPLPPNPSMALQPQTMRTLKVRRPPAKTHRLLSPSFLTPFGHFLSLSFALFLFGLACGGGDGEWRGGGDGRGIGDGLFIFSRDNLLAISFKAEHCTLSLPPPRSATFNNATGRTVGSRRLTKTPSLQC